jgi:hypothetical protein
VREVRALSIADEAGHGGDGNRAMRQQQLGRRGHAPVEEILAEAHLAELRVGALELAWRAAEGARNGHKRELAAVVACDDDARQQIQAATGCERLGAHDPVSDDASPPGHNSDTPTCALPRAGHCAGGARRPQP